MHDNQALKEIVQVKAAKADVNISANFSFAIDDKTLRSSCQNALVIGAMFLSDPLKMELMTMIHLCCRPVMDWHVEYPIEIRSMHKGSVWLMGQLDGGFMQHLKSIWRDDLPRFAAGHGAH